MTRTANLDPGLSCLRDNSSPRIDLRRPIACSSHEAEYVDRRVAGDGAPQSLEDDASELPEIMAAEHVDQSAATGVAALQTVAISAVAALRVTLRVSRASPESRARMKTRAPSAGSFDIEIRIRTDEIFDVGDVARPSGNGLHGHQIFGGGNSHRYIAGVNERGSLDDLTLLRSLFS